MFNLRRHAFKAAAFSYFVFSILMFETAFSGQRSDTASVEGKVTIGDEGTPVNAASVTIIQLGRSTQTDVQGNYRLSDIPPGVYDTVAHMHSLTSPRQQITVTAGDIVSVNLQLSASSVNYEVTVTAAGREETTFDTFQAVTTVDSSQLTEQSAFGLGEVIGRESGVHARSFGPGSSRPVVRGFDGDRVLVLSDGLPSGTLSSQSGEHAEPVDAPHLDRIEIVKGPATLLYGSNAIGGVVNMVTEHHLLHEHPHPGIRGQVTASGGTNSNQAGTNVSAEYGHKNWIFWGGGSRQVASDYRSPLGRVQNSKTRMTSGRTGFGWYGAHPFFNLSYAFNEGRLGIPFAGEFHHHHEEEHGEPGDHEEETSALVDETFTWQNVRINSGARGIGSFIDEFKVSANYSRWMHKELEDEVTATSFDNQLVNLRTTFTQQKKGPFGGTSGLQLFHRDYSASGEEALSPPVKGNGVALFTLQQVELPGIRFQFGGRFDHTSYEPAGLQHRSFNGFSGAAGLHVPLKKSTALVANYTHSFRAPALDELYNNGPHIGNLAYEIGDPTLRHESANGIDVSLRHESRRLDAEANFFYYDIKDFVYLSLTGETRHGLRVADFAQSDSRFVGGEVQFAVALRRSLWLESGLDLVDARFTATGDPLPRIPPLRGKLGLNAMWKGLSLRPGIVLAKDQENVYPTETRTPGYAVMNLNASYTLVRSNLMHVFSFGLSNAGNRLYRNHLSFIKDFAPEMGRAARLTYTLRLY